MAKFCDFFFSIKKHDLVVAAVVGAVAGLSVPGSAHQRVSKEELFSFQTGHAILHTDDEDDDLMRLTYLWNFWSIRCQDLSDC